MSALKWAMMPGHTHMLRNTPIAFAALIFTALASSSASAFDCEKFLKTHGFLSRAQFQCGFDNYPQKYLDLAAECAAHMSEARLQEGLSAGIKVFDARDAEEGRKPLCTRVRESFPKVFGAQ